MNIKPEKIFTKIYTVEGTGEFPIDMLRYDTCVPVHEGDAIQIQRTFGEDRGKFDEPRRVRIRKYSFLAEAKLTDERWRSFGWKVVPT